LEALGGRVRGVVAWYDPRKGYGFIRDDAGQDVFVHRSSIRREGRRGLRTGDVVEYAVEQTERGLVARKVRELTE
jgi:CspA family cold shock protein